MENKKYGNNMTISLFSKKFVIGLKSDFSLVLTMTFVFIATFIGYLFSFFMFYNIFFLIFVSILFIVMLTNYLCCFFKEPGIIPRRCEMFKIENKEEIKILKSNIAEKKVVENNSSEAIIKEIKSVTEVNSERLKQRKIINIFPEFQEEDNKQNKNENNNSLIFVKEEVATTTSLSNNNNSNNKKVEENKKDNLNNSLIFVPDDNTATTDNKMNTAVPYIFQAKPCSTCQIMRPSKASHCKICDNCILNKDHHCNYISNCVGERNHKNFFFFLFFGSLLSIFVFITSLYHFVYILFIYKNNLTKDLLHSNGKFIVYGSALIFIISLLLLIFTKKLRCVMYALYSFSIAAFIGVFYYNYYNKEDKFDREYHPFGIAIAAIDVHLMIFVVCNCVKQIKMIGRGLTIKQYQSIVNQKSNLMKENNQNYTLMDMYLKKKVTIGNIWMFLRRKDRKSLINK